jgi:hypothetical protein
MINKLENRRHVYIDLPDLETSFSVIIEEIDSYLEESFNLDTLSSDFIIYYSRGGVLMLGREVVGTDSQIKHHPSIKVKDYGPVECSTFNFTISSLKNLVSQIEENNIRQCRVKIKNKNLFQAEVYNFTSLEK